MADQITDVDALVAEITPMLEEMKKRSATDDLLEKYVEGKHPIPEAVKNEKKTKAYLLLMEMARTNFPKLVVDSVVEQCHVSEIAFTDEELGKLVWGAWQDNGMDAEFPLTLESTFTVGRSYVSVWADDDDQPIIDTDHASTTIVKYATGSRRRRKSALRCWSEGDQWFATLYHPEFIYRLQGAEKGTDVPSKWEPRDTNEDEGDWTIENPFGEVPIVEVPVNRKLKPAKYGTFAGEFADALGHIDRINYTIFSMLVAMTWSGFPLRGAIGDPILKDDEGNPLKPFDVAADSLVQVENPEGKLIQLPEATLTNFIAVAELAVKHFAAVTGTPAVYLLADLVNISPDGVRASKGRLMAKSMKHKAHLGEAVADVARLVAKVIDPEAERDPGVTVQWADREHSSLAERADAAVKLKDIVPWQTLAKKILGFTPEQVAAMEAEKASDTLGLALPGEIKEKADTAGVLIRAGFTPASAAALAGLEGAEFTGAVPSTLRLPESEAAALEQV